MYGYLILLIPIAFIVSITGQLNDDKSLPSDIPSEKRASKSSFDAQFHRGDCPDYFYQLDHECLHFSMAGKVYSWNEAQKQCVLEIAGLNLKPSQTSFGIGQSNMRPIKGGRQLVLNTPEKTKILEALYRDYEEPNYAVRLPPDYHTLHRCHDSKVDYWPQYCQNPHGLNATCFETSELGSDHVCLRQIDCDKRNFRLACEFTLPGSDELTVSKFRPCPKVRGLHQRLTIWAWLLVAVGAMLLLLLILGGVLAFIRNSAAESSLPKKSISETRHSNEPVVNVSSTRHNSAAEPMLGRVSRTNISDTGYLEHHKP